MSLLWYPCCVQPLTEHPIEFSGGSKKATAGGHENINCPDTVKDHNVIFMTIKVIVLHRAQEMTHTKYMLKEWWETKYFYYIREHVIQTPVAYSPRSPNIL